MPGMGTQGTAADRLDLGVPGAGCWAGWQQVLGLRCPLLPAQVCTHPAGGLAQCVEGRFGGELGAWAGAQGRGPVSGHRSWQRSLCCCRSLGCLGARPSAVQVPAGASKAPR